MITSRVMSAPSSAHPRRVANPSRSPRQADFADPLVVATDLCPQAACTFRTPYAPWFASCRLLITALNWSSRTARADGARLPAA
jgi:hypothetical protein